MIAVPGGFVRDVCPTCHGSGLRWVTSNTKPRGSDGRSCTAALRCPTCPDDGSGNAVGTGVIELRTP